MTQTSTPAATVLLTCTCKVCADRAASLGKPQMGVYITERTAAPLRGKNGKIGKALTHELVCIGNENNALSKVRAAKMHMRAL